MSKEFTKPAWVPMKFPERIQLLSRTRKVRSIQGELGRSISRRCHISSKRAIQGYLPYVKYIVDNNPSTGAKLVEWLGLSEDAMEYLGLKPTRVEEQATAEKKERVKKARAAKPRQKKRVP